jgi:serine/threonine-protein kinase
LHEVADFDGSPLGLVHRDVSPQNVFVTYGGLAKLLDFGIAKLASSRQETEAGVIKGKLRYMAPEQVLGDSVDRRSDLYALGVMLWEAATGQKMWKDCTEANILNRVLNGEITSPRRVRPELPEKLDRICMKALAHAREARYTTGAELEADIEEVLEDLGSRVNPRLIGQFVSRVFADVRQRTSLLVEQQLSKVASLTLEEYQASQLEPMQQVTMSATSKIPLGVAHTKRPVSGSKRGVVALSFGLLLAALAVGVWRVTGATPGILGSPPPMVSTRPVAPSPTERRPTEIPATALVSIRVSAIPAEARLFFDGEQLPQNPSVRVLPADNSQHIIRAEAPGYEPRSTGVVAHADTDVMLELKKVGSAVALSPVRQRARPRATVTAGSAAAISRAQPSPPVVPSRRDCDPPYFIDPAGTKRFKIECL